MNSAQLEALAQESSKLSLVEAMKRAKQKKLETLGKSPELGPAAARRATGFGGVGLTGFLKKSHYEPKKGEVNERTSYQILLYRPFSEYIDASQLDPAEARLDGETLILNMWTKKPFTPAEKAAHEALCKEKGWGPNNPKAKKASNSVREGTYEINSGETVYITCWREPFQFEGNDIPDGTVVLLQGVTAECSLASVNKETGEPYKGLKVSNIVLAPAQEDVNVDDIMRKSARTCLLPDLSEASGYGQLNRTEQETKEALGVNASNSDKKAIEQWKALRSKASHDQRARVGKPLVIDYHVDEIGRFLPSDYFAKEAWYIEAVQVPSTSMILTYEDGGVQKEVRYMSFQMHASVMENGTVTKVAILDMSPKSGTFGNTTECLMAYGLPDLGPWSKIGPILVPACDTLFETKVDLKGTTQMDVNKNDTNPLKNGARHLGFDFGVRLNITSLSTDLVSGIMRTGRQINLKAAVYFLEKATGSKDLSANCPSKLNTSINLNPLNKAADRKVLNFFLTKTAPDDLNITHDFFLIYAHNTPEDAMAAHLQVLKDNGDDNVDGYSNVITRVKDSYAYVTFPRPDLSSPSNFVVYAVNRNAAEAWRNRYIVDDAERDEEFQALLKKHEEKLAKEEQHKHAAPSDAEQQEAKRVRIEETHHEEEPPADEGEKSVEDMGPMF